MKTITVEECMKMEPCYSDERIQEIANQYPDRKEWTALDVLRLNNVPVTDRLWLVLREELIDAPILHEFACRCAERALSHEDKPDPRSVAAIAAKRAWLRGEITDEELKAARYGARDAAQAAAWDAECRWQCDELVRMLGKEGNSED